MKKVYKLTDQNFQTRNNTQWGENVTHKANGKGPLCGPGWLHFYYSPELAVLLNPIHAAIENPVLWEAETGEIVKNECGLKGGATVLTTVRQIPLPVFSLDQRIAFGIYCALEAHNEPRFVAWANAWLDGSDRCPLAADAVRAAADADADADAAWAEGGADSSARAARAAARAAADADAEKAADAAEKAAAAVAWAAEAVAWAAEKAADAADFTFLQAAAEKALRIT